QCDEAVRGRYREPRQRERGEAESGNATERLAVLHHELLSALSDGQPQVALRVLREQDRLALQAREGRLRVHGQADVRSALIVDRDVRLSENAAVSRQEQPMP